MGLLRWTESCFEERSKAFLHYFSFSSMRAEMREIGLFEVPSMGCLLGLPQGMIIGKSRHFGTFPENIVNLNELGIQG